MFVDFFTLAEEVKGRRAGGSSHGGSAFHTQGWGFEAIYGDEGTGGVKIHRFPLPGDIHRALPPQR